MRHGVLGWLAVCGLVCGGAWQPARVPAQENAAAAVGAKVPDVGSLRDLRGSRRPLHGFKGHRAVVVTFLGTDCPISNLYAPRLVELEKKYRPQRVQFLAVYPGAGADLDQIAAHAADRDLPFPALKDCGQQLADAVGVRRVPAVVVLDDQFVLRYRGRVDDQYGAGHRRPKAGRDDLALALDDLLAGKGVSVAETQPDGCLIDRPARQAARTDVTYAKQVSRILQKGCQSCHRPGETAPFPLLTYEDARRHGRMIKEVTTQRRMPPWHADPRYGQFANCRRLTDTEVETLAAWVDAGMPRGDDRDLPPPVKWAAGWRLGTPDLVISMPEEFQVPARGVLPYQRYVVDPGFKEDRWVRAAEGRPGNPGAVHHIVAYILRPGQRGLGSADGGWSILVGWAPGDLGMSLPPDTALRVPKGSKLLFEMHYTPNGTPVKDRSSVGITFAKAAPKYELLMNGFFNEGISLPPHDPHYKAENTLRLPADARLVSLTPHMHWRGKDYRYEVIYPDGRKETILSVPRWDFNWQSAYVFKEPFKLPKGARLHAVAHWDNSANNPYNPDPSKRVHWGLQTWDEMMVGWATYVWERPETAAELAKRPVSMADQLFDRLDRNGDGVITPDELPERIRPFLKLSGMKLPERITREEFPRILEEARRRFERNRPGRDKKSTEPERKKE
jgi:hypothetical protein